MANYLLTLLSIFVSVGLFLFGYRQTIGARRERARTANTDLEKVLLKRIVLEMYQPSAKDLTRLINGKARDHRVRPRDLLSEVELLEVMFTRIIESDFIAPDQRSEILERLSPILVKAEEAPVEEIRVAELPSARRQLYSRTAITMTMAVFATFVGVLVAVLPRWSETTSFLTPYVFITFTGSLIIIFLISVTYRLRESQEETSSSKAIQSVISARNFEREVGRTLKKMGAKSELAGPSSGFDFMAMIDGKKILIEVKSWPHRVPMAMFRQLVARLSQAIEATGADEAIVVTKTPVEFPANLIEDTRIRIMPLEELRNYIAHKGR